MDVRRAVEPHSANLLSLAMGLRLPRSELSPESPPEERQKEPMAMFLVYGEEGGYDGYYWKIF